MIRILIYLPCGCIGAMENQLLSMKLIKAQIERFAVQVASFGAKEDYFQYGPLWSKV